MICSDCLANTGVEMAMIVEPQVGSYGWRVARCYGCDAERGIPPVHDWTDETEDDMARHGGAGRRIGDGSSRSGTSGRHASDTSSNLRDMAADYRPGGSRYGADIDVGDVHDAQIRDQPTTSDGTSD